MLAVHENAGTLIFLGWIAIFWFLMYRYVMKPEKEPADEAGTLNCESCGRPVDPDNVPDECPGCGLKFGEGLFCDSCGKEVDPEAIPEKCPECGNPFATKNAGEPGH
jgi:methionyl-tRNA synthetase